MTGPSSVGNVGGNNFNIIDNSNNVGGNNSVQNTNPNTDLTVEHQAANFNASDLNELFDDTGNVDSQLLGDALFKLNELSDASADIFTLMALMIQLGKEQREGARHVRDAQRTVQQEELQAAADQIRKAADLALAAGIVSGVFKMTGGLVQIGGAAKTLKGLNALDPSAGPVDLDVQILTNKGRMYEAGASITGSVGDMVSAGLNNLSQKANAEQKEAEARAQLAETGSQREQEFMQNLQEMISKITGLLQDIQQQANESQRRAASV